MNNYDQLDFIDILSIMSFVIGLMNLEENLTQGDKQDIQDDLSKRADLILTEIHSHLKNQDNKLDSILNRLEVKKNET